MLKWVLLLCALIASIHGDITDELVSNGKFTFATEVYEYKDFELKDLPSRPSVCPDADTFKNAVIAACKKLEGAGTDHVKPGHAILDEIKKSEGVVIHFVAIKPEVQPLDQTVVGSSKSAVNANKEHMTDTGKYETFVKGVSHKHLSVLLTCNFGTKDGEVEPYSYAIRTNRFTRQKCFSKSKLDQNGSVATSNFKFDTAIVVGHELIHAVRFIKGTNLSYKSPHSEVAKSPYRSQLYWATQSATTAYPPDVKSIWSSIPDTNDVENKERRMSTLFEGFMNVEEAMTVTGETGITVNHGGHTYHVNENLLHHAFCVSHHNSCDERQSYNTFRFVDKPSGSTHPTHSTLRTSSGSDHGITICPCLTQCPSGGCSVTQKLCSDGGVVV